MTTLSIYDPSENDLIIIGNGLAAWGVLNAIAEKKPDLKILHLSADRQLPPCALNSTATVSQSGIQLGVSPLGDLLYESFRMTKGFIEKWNCPAITTTKHYHLGDIEKLKTRFGEVSLIEDPVLKNSLQGAVETSYLFEPKKFQTWFFKNIVSKIKNYQFVEDLVLSFSEDDQVSVQGQKNSYVTKKAILCTGAFDRKKFGGKLVTGHYLSWQNIDYDDSFLISHRGDNLIYNKGERTLMMGGTSNKDEVSLYDFQQMEEMYLEINQILKEELPPLREGTLEYGHRQKGKKRMPTLAKREGCRNLYFLNSLYKNGYTVAWKLGSDFIEQLY